MIAKMILISTHELAERIDAPSLRLLDASYFLPSQGRNARQEYESLHIRNANFFDIDAIADMDSALPHMLPTPQQLGEQMGTMGISEKDEIVFYDNSPNRSAARGWWSLSVHGATNVRVLDGGLEKWLAEGRETESGPGRKWHPVTFSPQTPGAKICTKEDVALRIKEGSAQILDARSRGRFSGHEPEPRPGLRSGHMPGAYNVPFTELLAANGTYLPIDALKEKFANTGLDLNRPIVAHCGSGITACVPLLGLALCGAKDLALYDGSWVEWGAQKDTSIVQ